MKRLDVYNLYDKSEITDEEAAKALGMTLKTFRFRCTKWGHRLPLLLAILDKIKEDKSQERKQQRHSQSPSER